MSESMEGAMSGEHPDEGTIHAWLDDALDAAESARVAQHVAVCARCAAATAEARGLIAGASRVVRSLDTDVDASAAAPAHGAPLVFVAPAAAAPARQTRWRVTPGRAAIAAVLLAAALLTLKHDRVAQDSALLRSPDSVRTTYAAASPAASAAARDPLLDSALRRNVEQALPPRRLERAPGPDLPVAPAAPASALSVDSSASLRVAEGRAADRAMRDTSAVAADHAALAQVPAAVAAPAAAQMATMGAERMTMTRRRSRPTEAMPVAKSVPAEAGGASAGSLNSMAAPHSACYRIEGATPGTAWGGATLPLVVRLTGSDGTWRTLSTPSIYGRWSRIAGDSVQLELNDGTVVVGRTGGVTAKAATCE